MNEEMLTSRQCTEAIQLLKRHFFLMSPLRVLEPKDFQILMTDASLKIQKILFQMLFESNHANIFKVAAKYKRAFLKRVISEIESHGSEVIEELYNLYVDLISSPDEEEEFAFRSYFLNPLQLNIVMKESTQIISSGTTGLVSWEACYTLSEWIVSNDQLFNNKVVLELGSGTGLLGVLMCKTCSPHTYIFSDHHRKVMELLCDNIKINNVKLAVEQLTGQEKSSIDNESSPFEICNFFQNKLQISECSRDGYTILNCECCRQSDISKCYARCWKLDWQNRECLHFLEKGNIDVIIGSDLVYDLSLIPSLVNVLAHVLRKSRNIKCYLGTTIRNEETYSCFLTQLGDHQLQWRLVDMDKRLPLFDYQRQSMVEILEITSKG